MIRSLKEIFGYKILAKDGEIGKVHEFYFDDVTWNIRYLVIDTAEWLKGRLVLISPLALGAPNWGHQNLPINLTKEQIENSPNVAVDKPISRQKEEEIFKHYAWPVYWGVARPSISGPAHQNIKTSSNDTERHLETSPQASEGDPNLRSTLEAIGYHIQAVDEEIGHVEDFIVDDEKWYLVYLVIDTRNWLPGGEKVLISLNWIRNIEWAQSKIHVRLTREMIKDSPKFDPSKAVNKEDGIWFYDYHGRPGKQDY